MKVLSIVCICLKRVIFLTTWPVVSSSNSKDITSSDCLIEACRKPFHMVSMNCYPLTSPLTFARPLDQWSLRRFLKITLLLTCLTKVPYNGHHQIVISLTTDLCLTTWPMVVVKQMRFWWWLPEMTLYYAVVLASFRHDTRSGYLRYERSDNWSSGQAEVSCQANLMLTKWKDFLQASIRYDMMSIGWIDHWSSGEEDDLFDTYH